MGNRIIQPKTCILSVLNFLRTKTPKFTQNTLYGKQDYIKRNMSFEWFEPLRYQNAKMHGIMHGIHTQYNTKILDGVQKHSMSFECF